MSELNHGFIISSSGGFYSVRSDSDSKIYSCRACGSFRVHGISPCVGDRAEFEVTGDKTGYIISIDERKNYMVRPPLSNIDRLVIVTSSVDPFPNLYITDKLLVIAEYKDIEPIIVITKTDLDPGSEFADTYISAGYKVISVSNVSKVGIEEVRRQLSEGISALIGNSGVGKSSLINNLIPNAELATGETSKKLGRGKHTTRIVEMYELGEGYIADTPGFSVVEVGQYDKILKEKLQFCFPEFKDCIDKCKYTGCSHTKEQGCKVLEKLNSGAIKESRHNSYVTLYEEAKNIKEWQL